MMMCKLRVVCAILLLAGTQLLLSPVDAAKVATRITTSEVSICKLPQGVSPDDISASENSTHVAFASERGGRKLMVVDGVDGVLYDAVGTPFISPTGFVVAYFASRDQHTYVVVNGKEHGPYDELGEATPVFSPDGKRLAYTACREGKWFVVVDDVEGKSYDSIQEWKIEFSPDSRRVAYIAVRGDKQIVVVEGAECGEYDEIEDRIIFSPDSKQTLWLAGPIGKQEVVIDGMKVSDHRRFGYLNFGRYGKRIEHTSSNTNYHIVVDGKEVASGDNGDHIHVFVLSPNGKRFAYHVQRGRQHYVVVDGVETACGGLVDDFITFSPDSNRLAYITATDSGRLVVVVDGVQGKPYETLRSRP